ncbi:MAG: uridine kinase [Gammaproteobacteria bacterium RIFCSPHIGHO2_02_FULL_42_13]|nr:MAG: uridine kinase [Gammaproteobacteria bacterium RIFCSPHIGHO2_02_FULL_42_13]OGT70065.1 MAG: uridine kinase [Gammaproteobacteria bacterium RIFCSPLOWO2_02_FULL_42_9]HLB57635.1 uridine kinase [Gammaproteobacteria bacterium]
MNKHKTIVIGIAGASGSGKSLLAHTIVNELGSKKVAIVSEDSYYKDLTGKSREERTKVNFDHPDAFDHELLAKHLDQLQTGANIEVPIYDHSTHSRKPETHTIGQHTIIVLEGILVFEEEALRNRMDIRIFMDTASDICLIRRLRRDIVERARSVTSVLEQYETTVRPMYLKFIEPSKRYADISVLHGGQNRIAIDVIKAKMRELLNGTKS